jgi:replicative DNA helicase
MINNVKVVFIDFLQDYVKKSAANVNNATGEFTGAMKQLSRELDISIVITSQLSRSITMRPNKSPMLSDMRDSGNIEQDADKVIGLNREEYHTKEAPKRKNLELGIIKNREGAVGELNCTFVLQTGEIK